MMFMTVAELRNALSLTPCVEGDDLDRPVTGCYIGDLLSWVMGRAPADSAWITVMQNANVAAVAMLTDVSCIILAENVKPDPGLSARAQEKGLNIYSADQDAYALACAIQRLLP
jgi:hypothetical protein